MPISVPDYDPDAVTLKLTGLSPVITKDLIEGYISANAEVKNVTILEGGNAIASVSGFKGVCFIQCIPLHV